MESLQQIAGPREFLLVGDSKLVSYNNLAAMITAGVGFVAPASKIYVPATVRAARDPKAAVDVDYVAERDRGKPADTFPLQRMPSPRPCVTGGPSPNTRPARAASVPTTSRQAPPLPLPDGQ